MSLRGVLMQILEGKGDLMMMTKFQEKKKCKCALGSCFLLGHGTSPVIFCLSFDFDLRSAFDFWEQVCAAGRAPGATAPYAAHTGLLQSHQGRCKTKPSGGRKTGWLLITDLPKVKAV